MRGSAIASLGFALLASLAGATARAEARRLEEALRVEAPVCLAAASLARAVTAWRKEDEVDARLSIVVYEMSPPAARFVLRRGEETLGERTIEAADASCDELREALALVLAVSIDALPPAPSSSPSTPPPGPSATVLPPFPAPPIQPPISRVMRVPPSFREARAPAHEPAFGFHVEASGGAAFALVPATVGFVSATAGARIGRRNALVGGLVRAGVLATSKGSFALRAGTAEARLAAGRLDGCVWYQPGRVGMDACIGAAAGSLAARGSGFARDTEASAAWAAITGRFAGRISLVPSLAIGAAVEAYVPVLAPRVEAADAAGTIVGAVPVAPIGLGLGAGLVTTFP